jgi:hypothetical protein
LARPVAGNETPAYQPLADPICSSVDQTERRLRGHGFSAAGQIEFMKKRAGSWGPQVNLGFTQEWRGRDGAWVLVRSKGDRACVVAVARPAGE